MFAEPLEAPVISSVFFLGSSPSFCTAFSGSGLRKPARRGQPTTLTVAFRLAKYFAVSSNCTKISSAQRAIILFARPGIGMLAVNALKQRDFPVIQGVVLFAATAYVLVNLIVDIINAMVDPRIEYK